MADVRFETVRKTYGTTTVVHDVDLEVADGEFIVLVGPSGCGKTTLLRCLAGLEKVDAGRVFIGGRNTTDLPPRKRRIAMVFQSYAIFPHMTVADNIAFGLRMQGEDRESIKRRVASVAELLDITGLLSRYSAQISGGQKQRVAVARALATRADVLLMDEPLSNLDALLRMQMRAELKALLKDLGTTTIYVTHDQVEALSMGDRVAVLNRGRIAQLGSPLNVYEHPSDTFVGGFVGAPPMNFLSVETVGDEAGRRVEIGGEAFDLPQDLPAPAVGPLLLGIRAEAVTAGFSRSENSLRAEVVVTEPLGSHNLLTVRVGGQSLKVSAGAEFFPVPGSEIWIKFAPEKIRWMDQETRRAIVGHHEPFGIR